MTTFKSGYINHRNRKIPIVWNGEHAQHIAEEFIKDKGSHPLLHIRIQQLAKMVKKWDKANLKSKRLEGLITDSLTSKRFLVIIEINNNFANIITCYRK